MGGKNEGKFSTHAAHPWKIPPPPPPFLPPNQTHPLGDMTFNAFNLEKTLCLQASKKIADAKLAKDFQSVLKEFQKAQRLAAERETAYTPFVLQAVLPSR